MRPLWKGSVSFGLVFVPVKMYAATEKKDVKFNYLHEKCRSPVQYKRFCPQCQAEVPMDEIVRGYQFEKGRYVIVKEEDMERLPGEAGRSIEILDFVNLTEIDPMYYDKAYYLSPGEGGQKVFELLRRAMEETGKVAVGRVIIRNKEALAVVRVSGPAVIMSTMYYPDEVRPVKLIEEMNYRVELHQDEIKMATNLVESLSAPFEADKYNNRYREALLEMIQARITGDDVEVPQPERLDKVVDLMAALKASIDLAKEERGEKKARATARGAARRKAVGEGAPAKSV